MNKPQGLSVERLGAAIGIVALCVAAGALLWHFKKSSSSQAIVMSSALKKPNIVPIAIIGSGPAGLSAALYGARAKVPTVVFQGNKPGGQLTGTTYVENWPGVGKLLGPDIMKTVAKQAASFGAELHADAIVRVDFSSWPYVLETEEGTLVHALSVIIATGADPLLLSIPGEKEYWANGVSTCAICEAPFFKDASVAVVGGGDSALEEAMQLAAYAKNVTLLVRGSALRASAIMQERLKEYPHISVLYNTRVHQILGDDKHVNALELTIDGARSVRAFDGVFLAIGHKPNTHVFKNAIACDDHGYIIHPDRSQKTSVQGVFAAGDVSDHVYRQAGAASGDGIKAALDALDFLRTIGFSGDMLTALTPYFYDVAEKGPKMELVSLRTLADFEHEVMQSAVPVIIDCYTPTCSSCMHMMPVVEWAARKFSDKLRIVKLDISTAKEVAQQLQVLQVPTMVVYNQGALVARTRESMNKPKMLEFLKTISIIS